MKFNIFSSLLVAFLFSFLILNFVSVANADPLTVSCSDDTDSQVRTIHITGGNGKYTVANFNNPQESYLDSIFHGNNSVRIFSLGQSEVSSSCDGSPSEPPVSSLTWVSTPTFSTSTATTSSFLTGTLNRSSSWMVYRVSPDSSCYLYSSQSSCSGIAAASSGSNVSATIIASSSPVGVVVFATTTNPTSTLIWKTIISASTSTATSTSTSSPTFNISYLEYPVAPGTSTVSAGFSLYAESCSFYRTDPNSACYNGNQSDCNYSADVITTTACTSPRGEYWFDFDWSYNPTAISTGITVFATGTNDVGAFKSITIVRP